MHLQEITGRIRRTSIDDCVEHVGSVVRRFLHHAGHVILSAFAQTCYSADNETHERNGLVKAGAALLRDEPHVDVW